MRRAVLTLGLAALLVGCQKAAEKCVGPLAKPGDRGRFVGVGIYAPGQLWSQLSQPAAPAARAQPAPSGPVAASLDDDDQVIVMLDTATGELRQCGNLSGQCIGMNPWADAPAPSASAPARLLKNARQLQAEAEAAAKPVDGRSGAK